MEELENLLSRYTNIPKDCSFQRQWPKKSIIYVTMKTWISDRCRKKFTKSTEFGTK